MLPTYRTKRTPSRYSDGPAAGRLIARKTGKVTTRWQQYVLDVGLERVDGPDSPYAYSSIDTIVGRRCGKTVKLMGVPLFRALCGPVVLDTGRVVPFTGALAAQNLVKARQRFMKDLVEPLQDSMSPAVWNAGYDLKQSIGDTFLTLDPAVSGKNWRNPRASKIGVVAPTISSVRGDGLLHVGIDEVLVFSAQRGDELMAAARPTLAEMRGHGQVWRSSNIAVWNDSRTWLYQLREKGRANVAADRRDGSAYFEFSMPDDVDVLDEREWWRHYPALGDGLIRPNELRVDLEELGVEHFAAEYMGRWPGKVSVIKWTAIDRDDWSTAKTALEQPTDQPAGLGVEIDPYGRSSSLVTCVADIVEVIDVRPGSEWVRDAVLERAPHVASITIDDYGAGHELIGQIADHPAIAGKLNPTRGPDFIAACYSFEAGLREHTLKWRASDFHRPLEDAAAAAERTPGRGWQWQRLVSVSQSPLVAATLAKWAAAHITTIPDSEIF